jgi:hypothetical protein
MKKVLLFLAQGVEIFGVALRLLAKITSQENADKIRKLMAFDK